MSRPWVLVALWAVSAGLLARLDDNTRRLHPQALAESSLPPESELREATVRLAADVRQARERGVRAVLYVTYAGHGNVRGSEGYLAQEDGRLTATRAGHEVLDRVGADETHLIVDACYSYYLAFPRGPRGARRPVRGFDASGAALRGEEELRIEARAAEVEENVACAVFKTEGTKGVGVAEARAERTELRLRIPRSADPSRVLPLRAGN